MEIRKELARELKAKCQNEDELGFGQIFTDHMFLMEYSAEKGWHDPAILPYGPISMAPSAMCLHYGQEIFEGLKAYRCCDGKIRLFRPEMNFKRLNSSNQRMVIPALDEAFCLKALRELVALEKDWVPHKVGTSLYIRPFIIATDPCLGVRPGEEYKFMIILSPSGAYYATGLEPVSIYVEDSFVRAVRGGIGMVKAGANYAISLLAQQKAHDEGYSQVLWLDGVERRYIEEVGAMNIFFKIGDEIVTPALTGSILPGITRDSALELCRSWGMKVSERRVSIDELVEAHGKGELKECFGTGTAAVISPVGKLRFKDKVMDINGGHIGEVSQRLYDTLTGIQWGTLPDDMGWMETID